MISTVRQLAIQRNGAGCASSAVPISVLMSVLLSGCGGGGGGNGGSGAGRVDASAAGTGVTLTLAATPDQVAPDEAATLEWRSNNASQCTASGGWSGSRATMGSQSTGPLAETTTFSLTCSGPTGNMLTSVAVEVVDKVIRWRAPNVNVDGTPLTDLAGYVLYWGRESRNYATEYRLEDPAATSWTADIAPGEYYFAMTAFDQEGNESAYSNEVMKVIP